jgi:hypothetical protein
MCTDFEIKYTRLARAALDDRVAAFEEHLRAELAEELPEEYYAPEIMFHSLEYGGTLFIAIGKADHLLVDTASEEQGPLIDRGPMKGRRIIMPFPDSEE